MQRVTSLGSASSASAGTDAGEGEAIGASSEEEGGAAPPGASRRGLSIGGGLEAAPNAGRASPAATRPSARSRLTAGHNSGDKDSWQRAKAMVSPRRGREPRQRDHGEPRASLAAHRQHVVGRVVALAVVRRLARVPARRLRAARRRARPRRRPRAARRRPPRRTDYHDRSTPGATSASGGRRAPPPPPRFRSATLPSWPHAAILSAPRVSRSLTK